MILLYCVLTALDDPVQEESIYDRLKSQNLFAPEVKRPRRREDPKTETPKVEQPPPPRPSSFDVAGIVLNNATQGYEVLIYDQDEENGTFYKTGEKFHGATVDEVAEDKVKISVEGAARDYRVGQSLEMIVKGRTGGRSRSSSSSDSAPAASASSGEPSRTTRSGGGGLLDRFRRDRSGGGTETAAPGPVPAPLTTPAAAVDDSKGGLVEKWKKWKEANP
jgi:type II secretory pathway component PulC